METMMKVSELEQQIKALEDVIATQAKLIAKHEEANKLQEALIANQTALIKFYEEQFKLSQRRQFGQSSEQSPDQLHFENMFNEAEDQADPSLPEPEYEEITYSRKKRTGKKADDLSGLPTERIDYEIPEAERTCPECGEPMKDIGVTVKDELEVIPAKVIHIEHAVHAYGCDKCDKTTGSKTIVRADAPMPLIANSLASASAVAYIAAEKYVNGTPLYRIEKNFIYDGVVLSRQTMANWLIYCAQNYLSAVYSLMTAFLLSEDVIHADETTVQVLHEPGREAKTKSYEWLYRTSGCTEHPIVIYEYQQTRKQDNPKEFLKDFKGYLHTDGYQAYHNLPFDTIVVGCWAHCRRYWEKVYEALNEPDREGSNAERGLVYINLLFAFEDEFRDLSPDERYKKRLEYSKPVSDDFFDWVGSLDPLPKSLMGEAVHYALAQRKYLENVYLDGRLELSNNRAERSIKPFVQGRKVWLFSNTPNGAVSSSIYYSIVETAKENHLNPREYIKYLLETLPSAKTSDLENLLPWSESIPDHCRVPIKDSNKKPDKPKYSSKNGPLNLALQKLRARYRDKDSI